jgi:hypothetical protein
MKATTLDVFCSACPPRKIRAVNATLGIFDSIGLHPASLSADNLLRSAQKQTGLTDFGDGSFRKGFNRLLGSLHSEAQLSPLGRIIAREEVLMALKNRLQLTEYHRANPEIGAGKIERPIFIIGMGRSGTTIMHELMALDDNLRVPQTWEVDHPFPPPATATYQTDPRIARSQKTLDKTDLIMPHFKKMHRMGATLPQECVRWTTGEFASLIFWTNYNAPSYADWLMNHADMGPAYRYHRKFLQLLQWRHPAETWALKSPGHLWSLEHLIAEYPDARFIQTHRDPLKILTSLSSLVSNLRKMSSNRVDPQQIAKEWAQWNARGLNSSVDFREKGLVAPENIIDISFHNFMDAPLEQMQTIYQHLGLELTDGTKNKIRDYLRVHSSEQHGSHDYRFVDTGLDLDEERERVKQYQDYFGLKMEIN